MALFKILRGNDSNLKDIKTHDGYAYFVPATGNFYIDAPLEVPIDGSDPKDEDVTRVQLNANKSNFLSKENDDNTYEIHPEKGVLSTNPANVSSEVLNENDYITKNELNTILASYLLKADLSSNLTNYVTKNSNNTLSGNYAFTNANYGPRKTNGVTPITSAVRYYRPILVSTIAPTADDGQNGDIWIVRGS